MDERSDLYVRLKQAGPIPLAVELSCRQGQLLALVGPSGSGKTTTLRAIAGLHRPAEGYVACGGEIWFDSTKSIELPPHRRRVGFVFQTFALFPHMTALRNVSTAMGHCPSVEREERARNLLALVHLDGLDARRPAELSGGQQQRVAIARALAREPSVLLLDEPFSAVDRPTRRRLHKEISELRKSIKIPIVLVTHDIDEAAGLADRMCVIDRGETLQDGTPTELMAMPASERVAFALDLPTGNDVSR